MGLPRAIRSALTEQLASYDSYDYFAVGYDAGVHSSKEIIQVVVDASKRGVAEKKLAEDLAQWMRRLRACPRSTAQDELTKIHGQLYVGIEEWHGAEAPVFRDVMVPRYFLSRLKTLNTLKQERDKRSIAMRREIDAIRHKIYASRVFPSHLKAIIFERDNYTCQVCMRNRTVLMQAGLHLECDHVKAWVDGGQTTYGNGQTICSDCNKAKHHAKRYLGLVANLGKD